MERDDWLDRKPVIRVHRREEQLVVVARRGVDPVVERPAATAVVREVIGDLTTARDRAAHRPAGVDDRTVIRVSPAAVAGHRGLADVVARDRDRHDLGARGPDRGGRHGERSCEKQSSERDRNLAHGQTLPGRPAGRSRHWLGASPEATGRWGRASSPPADRERSGSGCSGSIYRTAQARGSPEPILGLRRRDRGHPAPPIRRIRSSSRRRRLLGRPSPRIALMPGATSRTTGGGLLST